MPKHDLFWYDEAKHINIKDWLKLPETRMWNAPKPTLPITLEGPEPERKAMAKAKLEAYLQNTTKVKRMYGNGNASRKQRAELVRVFLDDLEKIFTGNA